jgi:hypothetical protein
MQRRTKYGLLGAVVGVSALVGSCLYKGYWEANQPEIHYNGTRIESVNWTCSGNLNVGFDGWTELRVAADVRRIIYGEEVSSQFKEGDMVDITAKPRLFDSRLTGISVIKCEE